MENESIQHLQRAFERCNRLSADLCASVGVLNQSAAQLQQASGSGLDKRNQSADAQLAARLRALVDAIPGAVVVLGPQGTIVETNLAARELLGEPLGQRPWREVVHRVFLPQLDQGELQTADARQFSISTRPLGYEPGQILLLSDVTSTRQLQRVAQQNLHLVTMGKMMASLAHQIRTPLASAMLYLSQIVQSGLDVNTHLAFSEKALKRIKHIEKLINDMLVFAHGGQFNMSQFPISGLFADLAEQFKPIMEQHASQLDISGSLQAVQLLGNRNALLGVFANLCMNAMDANDGRTRIQIKVSLSASGQLLIVVDDNGCGMDRHTRAHLFDPFFSTKIDGTGLGLAVVKSVIESHQGSIRLASRPGKGCRFRIILPCQQAIKSQTSKAEQR